MMAPQEVKFELERSLIEYAATVGVKRQVQNIFERRQGRYGADALEDWQKHCMGAIGECSVAKYRKLWWDGAIGNLFAADVGIYQVRATTYPRGSLVLHPPDLDHKPFIFVILALPTVRLMGWLYAREGKRREFWGDCVPGKNRPAFWVPTDMLRDMTTMPTVEEIQHDKHRKG
jgi:hypothetical protein